MGSYPKCYSIIDCELNPQLKADPRVYEVTNRTMRHASKTKTASKTNNEINLIRLELAVLKAIAKLPMKLQSGALEDLEEIEESEEHTELEDRREEETDGEPDENTLEEKKKKRMLEDFKRQFDDQELTPTDKRNQDIRRKHQDPEDALFNSETSSRATIQPHHSVLEYKIASLGFEPIGENGDQLMLDIGCY